MEALAHDADVGFGDSYSRIDDGELDFLGIEGELDGDSSLKSVLEGVPD